MQWYAMNMSYFSKFVLTVNVGICQGPINIGCDCHASFTDRQPQSHCSNSVHVSSRDTAGSDVV